MGNRRWAFLIASALAVSPAVARAAPARITAFEAQVHAAPDPSSPVVHSFPEDARVSVSEDSVNGFRRVRLPDGKVGYVAESALSLGAARPAAPPQAPSQAPPQVPPPPAYAPPPPPALGGRPPPPVRAPVLYPDWRYRDPTAFRHLGFFARFHAGLGYMGSSTSASATAFSFDSARGAGGEAGVAIGGAVAENVILAGHFWATSAFSPALRFRGTEIPNGGDFSVSVYGIGPSFDYYFMPANVYLSITPSMTWVRFSDFFETFDSQVGFGTRVALGKEWWVTGHVGLGLAGWFNFSINKEDSPGPYWRTYAGGLAFSATIN